MSFTSKSSKTSTDANGNPFIVLKGSCSDNAFSFERVIIGISPGGTACVPTDPGEALLSFNIPQTDFNHLLVCLKKPPVAITINYDILIDGISVTSISCISLLAGFTIAGAIAEQTALIPEIAESQKAILNTLEKVFPPKPYG